MSDKVTSRAKEMYDEHQFGSFSYGRESRERSDPHFMQFLRTIPAGQTLYDIGCGVGFWFETYDRLGIGREQIVGLDLAPTNVANLRDKGYEVYAGSVLDLPFEDSVADNTVCYGVIMITDSPERAFAELVRVTRPGGRLFVAVYNRWHPYFWLIYKATFPIRYVYWNRSKKVVAVVYPFFWLLLQVITRITMGAFLDRKSCRTTFMDQVITPRVTLYGKHDLRAFAAKNDCDVASLGYSRLYAMLSGAFTKRIHGESDRDGAPTERSVSAAIGPAGFSER